MRRIPFEAILYLVLAAIGVHAFGGWHAYLSYALAGVLETAVNHLDVSQAGPGLAVVTGFVTAQGATLGNVTLATGDSLQVQNAPLDKMPRLLTAWGMWQTAGYLSIRSTKFSDVVRGIQYRGFAATPLPLMPLGTYQPLTPTDLLIAQLSGSATAGDIEQFSMLQYYPELPGINGQFIDPATLAQRAVGLKPVECSVVSAAGGGYTGGVVITATEDFLKANTNYALVGYEVNVACCTVGVRGPDTGNLRVAGPGSAAMKHLTGQWFVRLSKETGLPLIPVINQANKGATFVDVATDENAGTFIVNLSLVELAKAA